MGTLSSLKLVAAKKSPHLPPVVQRRNKLVKRLFEQIQLAKAQAEGGQFAPTRLRTVKDAESGHTKTIEVPKRVKPWWFVAESGRTCVCVRYGAKVVELAKGKTAVELAQDDQLVPTLVALKQAVESGELDTQIEAVAGGVAESFKK